MKSFKDYIEEDNIDFRTDDTGVKVARNKRHMGIDGNFDNRKVGNGSFVAKCHRTVQKPFPELAPGGFKIIKAPLQAKKIADYFQSNLPVQVGEVKGFKSSGYTLERLQDGYILRRNKQ